MIFNNTKIKIAYLVSWKRAMHHYSKCNASCLDLQENQDETHICPNTTNDHKCSMLS